MSIYEIVKEKVSNCDNVSIKYLLTKCTDRKSYTIGAFIVNNIDITNTLQDFTNSEIKANDFFEIIVQNAVRPYHLYDVFYDYF